MDIRGFLGLLEENEELVRIKKGVSPKFELSAVISTIQRTTNKAVLFESVRGYPHKVASNLLGNHRKLSMALGCSPNRILKTLVERWGLTKCVQATAEEERTVFIDDLKLGECLPMIHHYEKDAGPYITGGIILAKDPETSEGNLSYHRLQMTGKDELRLRITPGHHLGVYFEKAEKMGESLPVAILIGSSPAVMLAASANLPLDWDELAFAASLQGEPIGLVGCKTLDLSVPVDTEIVIEGEILAGIRKPEGPYGDWLGNYVPVTDNHVFKAHAVTMKKSPIYYTILSGSPEDILLLGLPTATSVFRGIYKVVPTVRDVACWPFLFHCIVKLHKTAEGQAKQAAMAAFGANMEWIKFCIVVDEDVNIYDSSDVFWAIATRCCPERDVIVIPGIPSFRRDPHKIHWGRVAIDATAPLGLENEFERKRIPGEEELRIEDYT